ncbi:hypothetical protein Sjap_002660 [Stephania japonica]|uniref:NB-ARC domain-containing protein n=1 Tax=Stephania japonica TaxID=461633 RepID=A0AAP0KN69_9MAGN
MVLQEAKLSSPLVGTVASTIGSNYTHHLHFLSDDQCSSLFESRAFMQGEPKIPNLVEIGKEIVKKCKGVPLAVKVLGGLMRSKRIEQEWLAIRDDEFWELGVDVQKQVIEILKLSYNNLPPKVRQCFSYCSIFPKDYEIQKHEVIQLWMAQGFLQISKEGELMEDIGEEFIRILCTVSFFQIAAKMETSEGMKLIYKNHDLVHDVAQHLSRFECKDLVNAKDDKINENIRHLSMIPNNRILEIPKGINKVKKLRSFCSFSSNGDSYDLLKVTTSLPKLLQLRFLLVLNLSKLPLKELPSSIGGLKLLKYLDLSWSEIERLPCTISNLYNLQTFNLSNCEELSELPKSVGTLTQLRYFYTYCTYARNHETPRGLSKLHFLQMLDVLKLCVESASEHIAELEHLNYLGGTLILQNLGYVNDVKVVEKANFMGKKNLHTLDMDWKSGTQGDNVFDQAELLEALQPNSNLKELIIHNFLGLKLPWWMTNDFALPNLVKLRLQDCYECKEMKSLGELSSLKELVIWSMYSLSRIGEDRYNHQVAESSTTTTEVEGPKEAPILYRCLEKLSVRGVPNLEEWYENSADIFPELQELELCRCPKLRNMPSHFPSLQKLTVENVNNDTVRSITENITSLTSLSFEGSSSSSSEKVEEEVAQMLGNNKLLESLTVSRLSLMRWLETCPDLSPSLKELRISNCPALKIESAQLPSVESLSISDVKAFVVNDTSWSSKLSFLHISNVPEFLQLPMNSPRNNMHLCRIYIINCPQFQGFLSSPDSPWFVECLNLTNCPSILGLQLQGFTQLRYLTVYSCTRLQLLEGLQSLRNIQSLSIGQFSEELNDLAFLDAIEMGSHLISSLRDLSIYGWSLKTLPEQIQHLSRLESLHIQYCDGISDLPEWLGRLTSLEILKIWNCKNLMHLPSANEMRKLTSLRQLEIGHCPLLDERCKPPKKRSGVGSSSSEWHKISHLTKVSIYPEFLFDLEDEDNNSSLSRLVNKMRSKVC